MSLGDYEHTFRVTVRVDVRSKNAKPAQVDTPFDMALLHGKDGVCMEITEVEYIETEDLLPAEVRAAIGGDDGKGGS